jgi:hypothetical protein
VTMPTKKTNDNVTSSERFLIEEYQMLRERFHNTRTEGISRINLFFTVTSAVLGGILLLDSKNSSFPSGFFQLVLLVILLILAVIGYDIYLFMIARDRVSDRVERGMARIRRYFVERDKELEKFLVYTTYDNPTTYLTRSNMGLRRTVQIIESLIIALYIHCGYWRCNIYSHLYRSCFQRSQINKTGVKIFCKIYAVSKIMNIEIGAV